MINFTNQLAYFAFFQGLLLVVVFLSSVHKRRRINVYLLILVFVLLIGLIGKIGQVSIGWHRQIKGLAEFSILMFGSTVYLFVQSTLSEETLKKSDIVHYIPAFVYSLVVTFYYILPSNEVISQRLQSGELYRVVRILVGTGLAVNISYYILSIVQFNKLKKALQNELSYAINITFIRNFLIAIGTSLSIWLMVYLLSFANMPELEIRSREFIWLAITFIVLFLAYYQMVAPKVFNFEQVSSEVKYVKSKLTRADLDNLKLQLEEIMESRKPYLNSKLLKSELAEMMQINAPELSRLLNERIGMSFFEYVNYYRIHEFIRLAKTPSVKTKTLFALAQDAGFQSKSTFNKSFKQIMSYSPSEYLKRSDF